jgi:predicted porin
MKFKCATAAVLSLCAAAAVHAQASVTVYGRMDVGVMRQWGNGAPSKWSEDHYHTSRLGFRGTEDLGGGLSGIFKLEHRFLAKNGSPQDGATFWNDETYVGLASKDYGTLKLGRVYSPFYLAVAGRIDPFNGDGVGSMTGLTSIGHNLSPGNPYDTAKGLPNRDVRTRNAIDYGSPLFGGFSLQVQSSFSEVNGQKNGISSALRYDSPTLFGEAGYERKAFSNNAYTAHIGGGYVFGPVKVSAGYARGYYSDDEYDRGNKASSLLVGVTYNVDTWTLLAAASRLEMDMPTLLDTARGTGSNLTKVAIGAEYYLSKRTKVYGHYAHLSNPVSILFVTNSQRAMLGIDHAF